MLCDRLDGSSSVVTPSSSDCSHTAGKSLELHLIENDHKRSISN